MRTILVFLSCAAPFLAADPCPIIVGVDQAINYRKGHAPRKRLCVRGEPILLKTRSGVMLLGLRKPKRASERTKGSEIGTLEWASALGYGAKDYKAATFEALDRRLNEAFETGAVLEVVLAGFLRSEIPGATKDSPQDSALNEIYTESRSISFSRYLVVAEVVAIKRIR